jgi:Fic family protein
MEFNINNFIIESNLIDPQPNYHGTEIVPGFYPGDLMYDNQQTAYDLAISKIDSKNLNASDVLDIHRELTRNVDFFEMVNMSGRWRKINVRIGAIMLPNSLMVENLMNNVWTNFYQDCMKESEKATYEEKEKLAYEIHDLFECIHPFIDGNGRTGRILMNAARQQMEIKPLTIWHSDRYKYYAKIDLFRHRKYDDLVEKYNK